MSRQPIKSSAEHEKPGLVRDLSAGVLMLGVAGFYGWAASAIPTSRLDDTVGAAGAPQALAAALALLALVLIVRSAGRLMVASAQSSPGDAARAVAWGSGGSCHLRALGMLAFGVCYVLLLPVIGYAASIACLLFAVAIYCGVRTGFRAAVFAVLASGVAYVIFVAALGVPLPAGVFLTW